MNTTQSKTVIWVAVVGEHILKATIDSRDIFIEDNENNNYFEKTLTVNSALPDLVITEITWNPKNTVVGNEITFKAVVSNAGKGYSAKNVQHNVKFKVNRKSINWSSELSFSLAPGDTYEVYANVSNTTNTGWIPRKLGIYNISVIVDPFDKIDEFYKQNNFFSRRMKIVK